MRAVNIIVASLILLCNIPFNAFPQETIRLGTCELPPYTSQEIQGNGFVCKIVSEAFAMAGLDVEYQFLPVKRAKNNLKNGTLDGMVGSYPELEKTLYVSNSLVVDTISFFHLLSVEFDWETIDDLKTINIGATLGYDYGEAFQQAEKEKRIRVERTGQNIFNFRKLLHGRIKAFPMSTLPGYVLLYKHFTKKDINRLTNHSKPVRCDHLYLILSVSGRNKKLITMFNNSLHTLKESGKYDQYFDETLEFFRTSFVVENQP